MRRTYPPRDISIPITNGPSLRRKRFSKVSHLEWGESGIGMFVQFKLSEHMEGLGKELNDLFEANRNLLHPKTELMCGGVYGAWTYCSNTVADQAEALVKKYHASFLALGYNDRLLAQQHLGIRPLRLRSGPASA